MAPTKISPTISIEILNTGSIKCRPSMLTQPASRSIWLRRLKVMTDLSWADPIPVHVFLVKHPEGYILFDTGLSSHTNELGYFPAWMPTFRLTSRIEIKDKDGIGVQLKERGIEIKRLKVVLSHLHYDHSGGLPEIIDAPVFVLEDHWNAFRDPVKATFEGADPKQWPKKFTPSFLTQDRKLSIGPFYNIYPITSDGKILAFETPGHTAGHISLFIYGEEENYLLTGDATYSMRNLEDEETDGVNDRPNTAVQTLMWIKELAREMRVVVLPSHEWESEKMLEERRVYVPGSL